MGHAEPPGRLPWCGLVAFPTNWWSTALILIGCGNAFSDGTRMYNVCTAYSPRMVGSSIVGAMAVFKVSDVPLWPGRYKVVAHLPATRLACGHITPEVIIPITAHWSLLADPTVVRYLWEGHYLFLNDYYVRPIL